MQSGELVLNDSIIMIKNITGGINSATLSDLEPNTQYAVSVSSIGMHGSREYIS